MVEAELHVLFSDDHQEIARGVRHFVALAQADDRVAEQLIELVELAIEHGNDDSSAAVWTVVILGEIGEGRAISLLQRALLSDEDEALQDAARVALLRVGSPAIEALIDAIDEGDHPALNRAAYPVLGMVGVLDDALLTERVTDFLQERVEIERRSEDPPRALEELAQAISRVGDRRQLEPLREILREEFSGFNPTIQDSIEQLEENVDGVPIGVTTTPWEERYGWIFEQSASHAKLRRGEDGEIEMEMPEPADEDGDSAASGYGYGMNLSREPDED